jgi:toxin CptA
MHNAPTVSYPVGRSHFQAGLLAFLIFMGFSVDLVWSVEAVWGWRQGLVGLALVLSAVLAYQEWQRTPQGTLDWNGDIWHFSVGQHTVAGRVAVHLDFQFVVLLSLEPTKGPRLWLWAERSRETFQWVALRRAVFSRSVDSPVQTPDEASPVKSAKS